MVISPVIFRWSLDFKFVCKIWQCGGQMVDAPCSRVGHVYRKFAPFPNPGVGDFVGRVYVFVIFLNIYVKCYMISKAFCLYCKERHLISVRNLILYMEL